MAATAVHQTILLSCWKAIASYMGSGVRTAQRWEQRATRLMGESDFYLADSTLLHVLADEASSHGDISMRLPETRWVEARDGIEPPNKALQTLPFSFWVPRRF
jgi:hypothetical protein